LLDDARTVVVSCAAAPLGTSEAARASFAGIATPDQALVFVTTVKCGATADVLGKVKRPKGEELAKLAWLTVFFNDGQDLCKQPGGMRVCIE